MSQQDPAPGESRELPRPDLRGSVRLEEAIASRRSVREFKDEPLTEKQLSQLLWAAQGTTHDDGLRTAPSAGALYPLEIYIVTSEGVHHYESAPHRLTLARTGDPRPAMCRGALDQDSIRKAPAVFVIAAVYARTVKEYDEEWSRRYVDMEAGHAAQNLLLQAVAQGLGGVPIGAFHEDRVHRALGLPEHEEPVYLIPVGHPR